MHLLADEKNVLFISFSVDVYFCTVMGCSSRKKLVSKWKCSPQSPWIVLTNMVTVSRQGHCFAVKFHSIWEKGRKLYGKNWSSYSKTMDKWIYKPVLGSPMFLTLGLTVPLRWFKSSIHTPYQLFSALGWKWRCEGFKIHTQNVFMAASFQQIQISYIFCSFLQ